MNEVNEAPDVEIPPTATEIVRDEDVLSHDAQHALEQVGSSIGFILAIALLFALIPRGRRVLAAFEAAAASAGSLRPEAREARDLERSAARPRLLEETCSMPGGDHG